LVGDAPTQNLTSLADRLALSEHVQFLGPLDEEELRLFYRSIDLFAIPSHQEGFAIVGAEAMAAGCPVLSTRCGGPEEYVIHGVTGWLSNHTATDFAAKISSAVQMRYGLEHMRRTCHHLAASRYTTSAFAERLAHHMRAALRMSPIDQSARSKSDCSFYDDGGA
jgi:glycosyltransferase involved in cell wall biosynthesis